MAPALVSIGAPAEAVAPHQPWRVGASEFPEQAHAPEAEPLRAARSWLRRSIRLRPEAVPSSTFAPLAGGERLPGRVLPRRAEAAPRRWFPAAIKALCRE